ncbi:MAG TPA: diguanylate cyclase [Dokdonella sp.]|uniref:diguanylate cyclase n=1 Tax=Dokdonella sp. TaxID=2291710 RepID=UPI002D803224|nr:diguanylate cyclase [Dokdonella sp.]HET9031600.1 diguanylate cyclase [Dokdonella sp.]
MRLLLFLALIIGSLTATAADPAARPLDVSDEGAPTFTVFSSREGLSDEIWSTVGFDNRGFVWAGSASGLARFDGYRWTAWPLEQAHSLVRDMQTDANGVLWAIFEREGLARYDGKSWSIVPESNVFHQRFSNTHRSDGSPEYWVGDDNGLLRLDGNRWVKDASTPLRHLGPLVGIEQTETLYGKPRQWLASTVDGIWYREIGNPNAWKRFDAPGFDVLHVTNIKRSHDGDAEELWVLTYGDGLYRIRNDGIQVWRSAKGELPSEAIYSALATYSAQGERTLWMASRAGLLRFRNERISAFDRRNGLPSDAVRGIKLQQNADGTELLWLATEGGIARTALTNSQWQTVSLLGSRENGIFAVMLEPDDTGSERLWVGSPEDGLAVLADGKWRYFTRANGTLPAKGVRQIWRLADSTGKPQRLISLVDGQLLRIDDAFNFIPIETPWRHAGNEMATYALSRQQGDRFETWFASMHSGVYRWAGGRWTQFLADGAKQPWSVIGLAEQIDADGRSWLWAASDQGIAVYNGLQWKLIQGLPADSFRGVTMIQHASRPTLWAASARNGILRLDVSDPVHPIMISNNDVPPPPDPTVYSISEDSQGRLYVCTNNGVQQLTPGKDPHYTERVFRRRDGLVHDECNTNAQFVDRHDRYWVGTLGGLSVYDPTIKTSTREPQAKPLRFTEFLSDGKSIKLDSTESNLLPAGTQNLSIGFSVLSGLREQESSYRSQLLGLETEPGSWTTEHHRRFSRLPSGTYELKVEGRDYTGTASEPISLRFKVDALWWEQSRMQILIGLLALCVAAGLVLLYNRNLRLRQRHLKREVARRTSEIRAANQRLTELSYQDPLTGVANRRRLMEVINSTIERALKRSLPIGLIVIDVDHFKAYNDQHGHPSGDVALRAVAQTLKSAMREQDLVARFGGEEFACLLIDADSELVARCAERMRALVEALPPRVLGNNTRTITISAGMLSRVPNPGDSAADLLREADAALYRAKHQGRNRVCRV